MKKKKRKIVHPLELAAKNASFDILGWIIERAKKGIKKRMVQLRIDPIEYDLGRITAYRAMVTWTDTDTQPECTSFNLFGDNKPTKEAAVESLRYNIGVFRKGLKEIDSYFTTLKQ